MDSNLTIRSKSPLQELLLWLVCIWTPVLFIYLSDHREVSTPISSAPRSSPLDKTMAPAARGDERPLKIEPIGKERDLAKIPIAPRGSSAKATQRDKLSTTGTNDLVKGAPEEDSVVREKAIDESIDSPAPEAEALPDTERVNDSVDVESVPLRSQTPVPKKPYKPPDNPYMTMVQRRISNQWHAPSVSQQMEAVIRFKLEKSGEISEVEIEESSGNEYFDLAAKRAVLAASPLPSFPADIEGDSLNTHLRFSNESWKTP